MAAGKPEVMEGISDSEKADMFVDEGGGGRGGLSKEGGRKVAEGAERRIEMRSW